MAYKQGESSDRRKGPDLWLRVISGLGVVGWVLMFTAMIVVEKAKPPLETIATRFANIHLRTTWDVGLSRYLFYLMCLGGCISFFGIVINSRRLSRKNDHFRSNLIILGLISFFGIIMYLFFL